MSIGVITTTPSAARLGSSPRLPVLRLYEGSLQYSTVFAGTEPFPLSPSFLSTMPSSPTPRSPTDALTQFFSAGVSLRPELRGSALPTFPPSALASCSRRPGWGPLTGLNRFAFAYGLVDCLPPGRTDLRFLPVAETFTPELSPGESPPPGVRYNCGADWAICAGGTLTRWNAGLLGRTSSRRTSDSRACTGSLPGPPRTPQWTPHRPRRRPC